MNSLGYRRLRKHSIILNTKDGSTFKGVLWRKFGGLIELRAAEMIAPTAQSVPVDGQLIIERSNVSYYQVLD